MPTSMAPPNARRPPISGVNGAAGRPRATRAMTMPPSPMIANNSARCRIASGGT